MVPRALGPSSYGDFSYLVSFFQRLIPVMMLEFSSGFFVKLSQRPRDTGLVSFYLWFVVLVSIALIAFTSALCGLGFSDKILPIENPRMIGYGLIFAVVSLMFSTMAKILDAHALTFYSELVQITSRVLLLGGVSLLYFFEALNLGSFFTASTVMMALATVTCSILLHAHGHTLYRSWMISASNIMIYSRELAGFGAPILINTFVGSSVGIAIRYLLQKYGGSVEQGYFSFAQNIAGVCFFPTAALAMIITRDCAIYFQEGDLKRIVNMVTRFLPGLYSVTAYFACFIAIESHVVVLLFGGQNFAAAALPLSILATATLHQTYIQIASSLYLASGDTKTLGIWGVTYLLLTLPIAYLFLAPHESHGWALGATGLALQIFGCQIIGGNIAFWLAARRMKIQCRWFIFHQIYSVAIFLGLAWIAHLIVSFFPFKQDVWAFLLSGIFYSLLVLAVLFLAPQTIGLTRSQLRAWLNRVSF